ncbi:uncharacterized protein LOC131225833 isoform X1 [Magnolia sinica]|uniref:uncharacterized protein LOC131225833 isoform X1 n=1 Tax=Magnolia sinica TaxID=86752 RepID=UPI0026596FB7|nr:uncharacterized protein LOC131225833 isoform X1 [Magnolia sinica]
MQDPLPPLTTVYAMCQRAMISTLPSHSFVPPERSAHLVGDQSSLGLRVPSLSSGRISGFGGRGRGCDLDRSRGGRSLRGHGGRGRGRDGSRICSHCGVTNHTIDYCWQLHGRPTYAAASVASTVASETQSSTPTVEQFTSGESLIISRAAYDALMRLHIRDIPEPSHAASARSGTALLASSSPTSWVIDSGASSHITGPTDEESDWWGA